MKRFSYFFFGALIALVAWGYINHWFLNPWGIGCNPHRPNPAIIDTWTKPLVEAGFKPARNMKPDNIPDEKWPPSGGEVILHGTGTVSESSELVELIGVQTPDGKKWLTGWVGDRQISFQHLEWWQEQPQHNDRSDFSLLIECAHVDGPDFGAGVAWQPIHLWGVDAGPAVTIDLNRDLYDAPDWAAAGVRLSRDYGPFTIGGQAGYRIGEAAGLHLGVAVGIRIGYN